METWKSIGVGVGGVGGGIGLLLKFGLWGLAAVVVIVLVRAALAHLRDFAYVLDVFYRHRHARAVLEYQRWLVGDQSRTNLQIALDTRVPRPERTAPQLPGPPPRGRPSPHRRPRPRPDP